MSDRIEIDFSEWHFDPYSITSPCRTMDFWVSNCVPVIGWFFFFRDYNSPVPFLSTVSTLNRWRIWRAYKDEVRRRGLASFEKTLDKKIARQVDEVLS